MFRKNIYCVLGIWRKWHDMTWWIGRDGRRNDTTSVTSIVLYCIGLYCSLRKV
jgi:hypothetical protein